MFHTRKQAGTSCEESSKADLIQNFILKAHMLRFLEHSRIATQMLAEFLEVKVVFGIHATKKQCFQTLCVPQYGLVSE